MTADRGPDGPESEVQDGISIKRFAGMAPDGAYHLAPRLVPTLRITSTSVDITHAHNYHALPFLQAAVVGQSPLIVTPHYHGTSDALIRRGLLRLYRPLGRRGLKAADRVIAVSKWEQRRLQSDFDIRTTVVPNGVDDRFFMACQGRKLRRDRPYLLVVGRLVEYKGVDHVIRALPNLSKYDLLIAGTGPYRAELEELTRTLGVTDRVEFLGYVPDDELPTLYADATVYLSLSHIEAYGITVGEALAAGTPAVVRVKRGLSDWVDRDDCVGLADCSPEQVASAVRQAVDRMAPSAPIPTWDDCAKGVMNVYRRVLA